MKTKGNFLESPYPAINEGSFTTASNAQPSAYSVFAGYD
jgi:hypothetical protein